MAGCPVSFARFFNFMQGEINMPLRLRPRDAGTNPRALGKNPKVLGTNPKNNPREWILVNKRWRKRDVAL
jgi:hypothetical protein